MPNKKLIIVLFLSVLLVMSGCRRRNEFLEMLEATPLPQNIITESDGSASNNEGLSGNYDYSSSGGYVPLTEMTNQPADNVDYGSSYTNTTGGARNTGGSGSSASYSDVPERNTGSGSSSNQNISEPYYYPNVIGLTEEEALDKLDYCGLDYDYIRYEASYAPAGTVLYQSFPADLQGDTTQPFEIGIVISAGNVPYPVPRSGGIWSTDFIRSLPRDAQTDVVIIFEYSLTRLGDQGIYTIPAEGLMNTLGSPITFYVSKGMIVGDYVGKEFVLIYPELSQGVAYYRNFIGQYSDTISEGEVISQNHPPGTVLTTQSTEDALVIVYSIGPDSSRYTATPVPQEGNGELPVD
jgi:beta-lactam-binding protein with PASTA domain